MAMQKPLAEFIGAFTLVLFEAERSLSAGQK
jgi:hypothetical protein